MTLEGGGSVAGERMPSAVEMENAFGGRGVHATTHDAHRAQLDDDRRGRLMREAQVMDNCTVQIWVPGAAVVHKWRRESGLFIAAKLLLFALAQVPEGYRANVGVTFTGPAIRIGV